MVLALPAKLPVTFPTTLPVKLPVTSPVTLPVKFPVTLPVNDAVTVPALKLPVPSLLTNVLGVLFGVAAAIVEAISAIVEELTPPILFDEAVMLVLTKAVVAICEVLVPSAGVGAMGVPVKVGDTKFAFKSNAV